jgi:hypothetical protein
MADEPFPSPVESPRIVVVPRGQIEVPGTRYRIGLDPLIGLIPVLGDLIAMAIGSYIVLTAARLGVPRAVVMRMLVNLGIDVVLGAVPFAGDVLDAAWKANSRNARLLEQALDDPKRAGRSSFWALLGLFTVMLVLLVGSIALSVWVVMKLVELLK